ncbi:MAG: molybdenum cofactor guanylyltransferase [Phycisphaerales bacterium]
MSGDQRKQGTGAILAGGSSRRMGAPKSQMRIPSLTMPRSEVFMLRAVADVLAECCNSLILVGGSRLDMQLVPEAVALQDDQPGHGPLAAIMTLLRSNVNDSYVVVPCDLPGITTEIVVALRDAKHSRPLAALKFADEPGPRPLPIRVHKSLLPHIESIYNKGSRSIRALLDAEHVDTVAAPDHWKAALANVNDRDDLRNVLSPSKDRLSFPQR